MTSLDDGIGRLRSAAGQLIAAAGAVTKAAAALTAPISVPWDRLNRAIKALMPKDLVDRGHLIAIKQTKHLMHRDVLLLICFLLWQFEQSKQNL